MWRIFGVFLGFWVSGAAAQDADLTIEVRGDLLEHGGVVEVIALTDRYAQVFLPYPEAGSYAYRFVPDGSQPDRAGLDRFRTEALTIGGRDVDGVEGDMRRIRVFPFEEYGGADDATRTSAAWGETQAFADVPPANHWGARALPWVFDTFGDRRTVGLICGMQGAVEVCTPDPADTLLMEALWWRSIAEGRLERLRNNALRDCYDGGGLLGRPSRCEAVAGDGWPTYQPAD
ncbi:MAG: hypothetical protein AAGL89_02605 [Pseudomonadota bacterium]